MVSKNFYVISIQEKVALIWSFIAQWNCWNYSKNCTKNCKLHGVLDNQNFYSNLMFFKVVVFMKKSTKNNLFLNKIALNCNLSTKLHWITFEKISQKPFFKKIATYTQNCIKLHKILAKNLFFWEKLHL